MTIGIYPGTFDPITLGHTDIIKRALNLVDTLVIAVAADTMKTPIFSLEERKQMVQEEVAREAPSNKTIEIVAFEGLLVDLAKERDANVIIRGLRAVSDFEYEFQMSCVNSQLNPQLETVFLPASTNTHFISSRFVKEVARLGGDISGFVSKTIADQLCARYK